MSITTHRDLTRWMDDAQHALDHAPSLTIDQLRALAAIPDQPGRDGDHRRTWWSEESGRVAQEKARDRMPTNGAEADVQAWRERQDRYEEMLEDLADAHGECLVRARGGTVTPRRKKRRTAADDALAHVQPDAA